MGDSQLRPFSCVEYKIESLRSTRSNTIIKRAQNTIGTTSDNDISPNTCQCLLKNNKKTRVNNYLRGKRKGIRERTMEVMVPPPTGISWIAIPCSISNSLITGYGPAVIYQVKCQLMRNKRNKGGGKGSRTTVPVD